MKLDDLDLIALLVMLFMLVIAIVSTICVHDAKRQKKRKPNIRVPRETLWGRTNRYHEGK